METTALLLIALPKTVQKRVMTAKAFDAVRANREADRMAALACATAQDTERTLTEEVVEITKNADTWKECVMHHNRHQKDMWVDLAAEMSAEPSAK